MTVSTFIVSAARRADNYSWRHVAGALVAAPARLGKATMAGLFQRAIDQGGAAVALTIDGEPVQAQQGDLLITAILLHREALRRFEFGSRLPRRLLPDGGVPGLLGPARRRPTPARLLDAGRAGHGRDHRRGAPWLSRSSSSSAPGRPACARRSAGARRPEADRHRRGRAARAARSIASRPRGARAVSAIYGFEAKKAEAIHRVLGTPRDRIDYRPRDAGLERVRRTASTCSRPRARAEQPFDRLVLATGAMDRALPFPGWTLPGVFTLGGAQIALKAQGVAIGRRVALVGAGPLLPLVAHQYAKAGVDVVAALDATPFGAKLAQAPGLLRSAATLAKGLWYTARNRLRGLDVRYGVRSLRVEGDGRVEALVWRDGARAKSTASPATRSARRSACARRRSSPTSPAAASSSPPTRANGCRSGPRRVARASPASTSPATARASAAPTSPSCRAGAPRSRSSRTSAATSIAREVARLDRALARQARFRRALDAAYPFPGHLVDAIGDDEIVCRCEGITAGALRQAARDHDAREINRAKAFTRIGMGRCQGRVCGEAAAELLARACGSDLESVGRLRGQPPVKPIPIARERLMTERLRVDVTIVGGGIAGCAAAVALRKAGLTVALLEKNLCGAGRERRQLRRRPPAGPPSRRAAARAPRAAALGRAQRAARRGRRVRGHRSPQARPLRGRHGAARALCAGRRRARPAPAAARRGRRCVAGLPWLGRRRRRRVALRRGRPGQPAPRRARRSRASRAGSAPTCASTRRCIRRRAAADGFETRTDRSRGAEPLSRQLRRRRRGPDRARLRRRRAAATARSEHARHRAAAFLHRPLDRRVRRRRSTCARSRAATRSSAAATAGAMPSAAARGR